MMHACACAAVMWEALGEAAPASTGDITAPQLRTENSNFRVLADCTIGADLRLAVSMTLFSALSLITFWASWLVAKGGKVQPGGGCQIQ